jgi:hypothetical protein
MGKMHCLACMVREETRRAAQLRRDHAGYCAEREQRKKFYEQYEADFAACEARRDVKRKLGIAFRVRRGTYGMPVPNTFACYDVLAQQDLRRIEDEIIEAEARIAKGVEEIAKEEAAKGEAK